MTRCHSRRRALAAPLAVLLVPFAAAQGNPGAGVNRETMWPAPTAEDWKRPCLVTWQRSFADAVAVSRATGRAILVCVNMDGEIASEHYAGVRYRQPEIAALYEPYVCVIASVYRHTPRDHDEEGRRILCPRFGSVTCGEHIAIEPGLHDRFFEGRRIAPRHIGVELDGAEMYDVFYAWDTDTIFDALRDGIAKRPPPPAIERGERTLVELVASNDIADRRRVEAAYQRGDRRQRRALLDAAVALGAAAPVDLLRLAVCGLDDELNQLARRALPHCTGEGAVDLIGEALRAPIDAAEREALIAALVRLGESSPRARTLATAYRGLTRASSAVDVDGWSQALAAAAASPPTASDSYAVESRLESQVQATAARPSDAQARLELAEATLAFAADLAAPPKHVRLVYEDALRTALDAERLGASGWRVNAAVALAAFHLGDLEQAHARAERAVGGLPAEAPGRNAMAVLDLFAQARWQAIRKALVAKTPWPGEWLTDVNAAYTVLARHPLGTDAQVAAHYDILKWLGAAGQAARVLDDGLARFAASRVLHDRLRGRLLAERGAEGLEAAYEQLLRDRGSSPELEWFAGYAALVAAEFQRRAGNDALALAAYGRGIAHYERAVAADPSQRGNADHYVALALAGRARLAYERADYEGALAEVLASFARGPDAAATQDGLNISPVDTAKMLLAKLKGLQRQDLVARLEHGLASLDPEMLRLPAYERAMPDGAGGSAGNARPPRRRRG